jgi:hypothetical protein
MLRTYSWAVATILLVSAPAWAADKYSIKEVKEAPPKELDAAIAKLLSDQSIQLLKDDKELLVQVWFRQEIPAQAQPEQIKNGLTYREVKETTVLGVIKVHQQATEYRKQAIKPGVYTLRLGFQPQDGDHMGTAPHPEFCLLCPAAKDKKPDPMSAKELHELSLVATGTSHPGVMLLFPGKAVDKPTLKAEANDHFVLQVNAQAKVGDQKVPLPIALTLIGVSPSA